MNLLCPRCGFPLPRLASNLQQYGIATPEGMAHIACVAGKRLVPIEVDADAPGVPVGQHDEE